MRDTPERRAEQVHALLATASEGYYTQASAFSMISTIKFLSSLALTLGEPLSRAKKFHEFLQKGTMQPPQMRAWLTSSFGHLQTYSARQIVLHRKRNCMFMILGFCDFAFVRLEEP